MSNRAQQSIDDGSMTAVWAVVDNGCLETPLDNGAVVRQKGRPRSRAKNDPALGRVKSDDGGSRYTERCVGPRRRLNGRLGRVAKP